MNAKKLIKLSDRFRQAIGDAIADGEPLPMVDAIFPPALRKQLRKRYPHQVIDLLDDLQAQRDAAQEAIDELDMTVDTLEMFARLLERAEHLQALEGDLAGIPEGGELPPLVPDWLPDDDAEDDREAAAPAPEPVSAGTGSEDDHTDEEE